VPIHILSGMNTYPANRCVRNLNTKLHFRLFAYSSVQEFVRAFDRVRMREEIAHCPPDFAIFACLASDSASSSRHGQSCIVRARAASIIGIRT